MTCALSEKVSQLIDGELPPIEARDVERHLLSCSECQQVRSDFLSLRNQISDYVSAPIEAVPRIAHLLSTRPANAKTRSRGRWLGTFGVSRLNPALASVAAAAFLIVCGITLMVKLRSQQPNSAPSYVAQNQTRPDANSSPIPSQTASPDPHGPRKGGDRPPVEPDQRPAKFQRREAVTAVQPGTSSSRQGQLKPNSAETAGGPESDVGMDYANGTTDVALGPLVGAADSETLTAQHVEQSELLLRSFRNLRHRSGVAPDDLDYERRRAQKLFYQNVVLRREADSAGDVEVASLLESLEPILLDIANLPQRAPGNEVQAIKDRVERQNLVALLQINSSAPTRTND